MKRRLTTAVMLAAMLVLCAFVLSACSSPSDQVQMNDDWIVTFNHNDRDQALTQVYVKDGQTIADIPAPTREDHVFTGWYATRRCAGDPFDFSTPITDDLFLYAGWTTTKVRVIFNYNYEGAQAEIVSVDGGAAIAESALPTVPERENMAFTGWYTDTRCVQPFDFAKMLTKDVTVYAGWQQLRATVSFDLGYFGAENPAAQTLDLTKGEKVTEPAVPQRGEAGDYRFEGWYAGSGKQEALFDFSADLTGDVALRAKWTMLRATVTYDMNAEGIADQTEKVAVGGTAVHTDGASREGYDFVGWYFDEDCTAPADLATMSLTDDVTVYAAWTAQPRSITYNYNYEGAPAAQTITSHYDAVTVEPAEPSRAGDEFIGWFTDATQQQPYTFGGKLTADLMLYAGWSSKTAAAPVQSTASTTTDSGKNLLTFYMNDGTDAVFMTEEVARNKYSAMRTSGVSYPTREGYQAAGWYTTPDCQEGTEFNVNTRIRSGMDLYVKWVHEYVFEAEMTQLTNIPIGDTGKYEDKLGFGESSNPKGLYLIEWDCYNAGASNEYYVSYLYNPGSYLEFCITAEEEVTNATLVLRLTPELHDMYFATGGPDGTAAEKDGYKIYVNPVYSFNTIVNKEQLEGYDQVFDLGHDLTGAVTKDEDPNYTRKRAFEDYTVTMTLNLRKGENIIRLVTDNTHDYGGSMHSAAPMVDCIKILTNVNIGWTEGKCFASNLDGIDVRWPAKQN